MKQFFLLILWIAFAYIGFSQEKDAWLEDFNGQSGSGYITGDIDINGKTWSALDAGNFEYGNTTMGSPAFTINDDKPGAHITSPSLNTCGTVSFKYAYKSGTSSNVFKLQVSTDGSSFTDLDTHTLGASAEESYVNYSYAVNINSATVFVRILSDNQDAHLFIDDYEVTDYAVGVADPTNFSANSTSPSVVDLQWNQNGNGDQVMVAWTSDGNFGTPVNGNSYSVNSTISGGGTVIYNGPDNGTDHNSLTENTTYYYKAWSVDGSDDYSNGVTDNAHTLISLPINEGVEGGALPSGWTVEIVNDAGTDPELTYVQTATNPTCSTPAEGIRMIHFNSYYSTAGSEIRLCTPPFSTVGVPGPTVDFSWFESSAYPSNADGVTIQWSEDGLTWNTGTFYTRYNSSEGWKEKSYALPAGALGKSKLYVGFLFHSEYGNNCLLDDIEISGLKPEPTNHAASFASQVDGINKIDLSWDDNDGAQAADGFLIVGSQGSGTLYVPVDGTDPINDTDWSDDNFEIKIDHGVQSYEVVGLTVGTDYNFKIYPYTNSGVGIDFKTDGTIPHIIDMTPTQDIYVDGPTFPAVMPPASVISSIVDTPAESQLVFIMTIHNPMTSGGYFTGITKIRFTPHSTNTIDWSDNVQGMELANFTTFEPIYQSSCDVTDSYIDINIPADSFVIQDGIYNVVYAYVYLNSSNIEDNGVFSCMIDGDNHGFVADPRGAQFIDDFSGDLISNDHTIEVTPTELQFVQNTTTVGVNTNMSPAPSVAFTDANGNIDLDLTTSPIEMTSIGSTLVGSPVSSTIDANGLATFSSLSFSSTDTDVYLIASDKDNEIGTNETVNSDLFDVSLFGTDVFISEVVDPADVSTARYVELFNPTASAIDLSSEPYYLKLQSNGSGSPSNISLTGVIQPNTTYICAFNDGSNPSNFEQSYGNIWDQENSSWSGNGDDNYYLYKGATLIDMYGVHNEDGTGKDWEYTNSHAVRNRSIIDPNSTWTATEWTIVPANADQMTPGKHAQDVSWQGINPDWNTKGAGNWSGGDFVPDASYNVTIGNTSSDPIITEFAACNIITIGNSDVLTVSGGVGFTIVQNGWTTSANSLVLKSDATGPASLIHNSSPLLATVESYFPDLNKWYLISPPIEDATANVFFDEYLDYWDEPTNSWVDIEDETTPLASGKGYSVKKTTSHWANYFGSLSIGSYISGLRRTSGVNIGWNLVGNPFPCPIAVDKMNFTNWTNLDASVSVWPHNGLNVSAYLSYSQGTGGDIEAKYIQPGQGFMVRVSDGYDNQNLEITYLMRTHDGLGVFDKNSEDEEQQDQLLSIEIFGNETTKDKTYIGFREGATPEFDSYYDVSKLFGQQNNPHVFSYIMASANEKAAIQSFPPPSGGDILHLGTQTGLNGDYQMIFRGMSSFNDDRAFILLDKKNGEVYDLRIDSIINFTSNNGGEENRFDLLFDFSTNINTSDNEINELYFVTAKEGQLNIRSSVQPTKGTEVFVYNMLGQLLIHQPLNQVEATIELDHSQAYYMVLISSPNSQKQYKILMQ